MLSMMMLDDHDAVCCMIMFGVCYGWSMLSKMMLDDHDAVWCMIMFGVWVIWTILSMIMLDDHGAVCCMIMFGVWYRWSMLSKMMLDDHDAVCCFLILVDWVMVHVVLCLLWCYMMPIMMSFSSFHNNRQQTFQIVQGDDCSAGWWLWWIGPKTFCDATWWGTMTLMWCCTFQNMRVPHSTYIKKLCISYL